MKILFIYDKIEPKFDNDFWIYYQYLIDDI